MSAQHVAERVAYGEYFAEEFARIARTLLGVTIGTPEFMSAVASLCALLQCYDERMHEEAMQ
jgi:hypothetical protein